MKRRNFIKAIGGALAALPFVGLAGKTQAKPENINRAFLKPAPMAWPGVMPNDFQDEREYWPPIESQEIRADRQIIDIIVNDLNHAWDRADDATKEAAILQADKILKS